MGFLCARTSFLLAIPIIALLMFVWDSNTNRIISWLIRVAGGGDLDKIFNFFLLCVQRATANGVLPVAFHCTTFQMPGARSLHEQVRFCAVKECSVDVFDLLNKIQISFCTRHLKSAFVVVKANVDSTWHE